MGVAETCCFVVYDGFALYSVSEVFVSHPRRRPGMRSEQFETLPILGMSRRRRIYGVWGQWSVEDQKSVEGQRNAEGQKDVCHQSGVGLGLGLVRTPRELMTFLAPGVKALKTFSVVLEPVARQGRTTFLAVLEEEVGQALRIFSVVLGVEVLELTISWVGTPLQELMTFSALVVKVGTTFSVLEVEEVPLF